MNRIIPVLFILQIFIFNSFAQQIPNNSFETWSGGEPDSWGTSNQNLPIIGTIITVSKDVADPQLGSASAKLSVVKVDIPFVGTYKIPGALTLGKLNVDLNNQMASVSGGSPFTGKPLKLTGYFKYQPVNNDKCFFSLWLFRWVNGAKDTLGIGAINSSASANSWTRFEVPIYYTKEGTPDSVNILFLNSNPLDGLDHTGTAMWIDNLSFDYGTVGIESITTANGIQIYAEPDARQLILSSAFGKQENLDISLFNMSGIETRHWNLSMQQSTERLDINNLSPGTYLIRIASGNRLIDTRKITILN